MVVVLIFPPGWSPFQPYLSLPVLAGALERAGHQVILKDLNIEFYDKALSAATLAEQLDGLDTRRTDARIRPDREDLRSVVLKIRSILPERAEDAKDTLRSPSLFYDFHAVETALRALQLALSVYTLTSDTFAFRLRSSVFRPGLRNLGAILRTVEDIDRNIFNKFASVFWVPEITVANPSLVGISVTSVDQLVPALGIANLVKLKLPGVHVCVGGRLITRLQGKLSAVPEIWKYFDSAVLGDGEDAIVALADAIVNGKRTIDSVPNLIFRSANGAVRRNRHTVCSDRELVDPHFDGLPLNKYLSPEIVFPIELGRGCHWSRCSFCEEAGGEYHAPNIGKTVSLISYLVDRFGARYFAVVDPCSSASSLQMLARALLRAGIQVFWKAFVRAEEGLTTPAARLLAESGCKMLMVGIESASPRILRLMSKGVDIGQARNVLKNISDAGIWVHGYFMFGFPSESDEDIEQTLEFITRCSGDLDSIAASRFTVPLGTPIASLVAGQTDQISKEGSLGLSPYLPIGSSVEVSTSAERQSMEHLVEPVLRALGKDHTKWMLLEADHIFLYVVEKGKGYFSKTGNES